MTLIGLAILVEFHLDEKTSFAKSDLRIPPPHDTGVFCFFCVSSFLGRMLVPLCWVNRDFGLIFLSFGSILQRLYTYNMLSYIWLKGPKSISCLFPNKCRRRSVSLGWCNWANLGTSPIQKHRSLFFNPRKLHQKLFGGFNPSETY